MPGDDVAPDPKPAEFEQALAELEKLVETLERGDLPLDEALRSFERGVELTRHCQSALKTAQQRVEILLRRNGGTDTAPFEASAAEGSGAAEGASGAAEGVPGEPTPFE